MPAAAQASKTSDGRGSLPVERSTLRKIRRTMLPSEERLLDTGCCSPLSFGVAAVRQTS
jgi:hypothetical protein